MSEARRGGARGDRTSGLLFALATLVAIIPLALVATQPHEMQSQMFRDTFGAARSMREWQFPPFLGIVSNFGIVLWCAAWAVASFSALALLRRGATRDGLFLLALAILSGLLLADDMIMLHEHFYPRFGLHETALFPIYAVLIAAWVAAFRDVVARVGPGLLLAAFAAFSLSVAGDLIDHVEHGLGMVQRWMEDAPKLFGIAYWAAFAMRASWMLLELGRAPRDVARRPV